MAPDNLGQNARNNPPPAKEPEDKNNWAQMAKYAELAFVFPAATVAGWLIGVGLDHWLHTTWLEIAGLIAGIIAGFVQLIRTVAKAE